MRDLYYSIYNFDWDTDRRTLNGKEHLLYPIDSPYFCQLPFPNGRGKFYIKNEESGGFRRFIYYREYLLTEDEVVWVFKSEDDILCEIIKKI